MRSPIIFVVDDDPQVLKAVSRDLKQKYRKNYRVMSTESAVEALASLETFKKQGDLVALFLSDQRMPEMLGVDFLAKAKEVYPNARKILLTAYSDTDAAIRAINDVNLDYYLTKPWDPPEERLYPLISDQLQAWAMNNKESVHNIRLLGYQYSPKSHQIKDFLSGNLFPYEWLDVEHNPRAAEVMMRHDLKSKDLPAIIFEDGEVIAGDSLVPIAAKLGLQPTAKEKLYDVAIIGGGPSGLAAAVYGGSEGLRTILIEKRAPGGQAGTSSRIENYLGFPNGLSGAELSHRAFAQATRFGTETLIPQSVERIEMQDGYKTLVMVDGTVVHTRAIVVTTGVSYRMHEAKALEAYTGAGVYYGAATTEAASCRDKEVYVVGGGNSAGQGAVYLSNFARKVHIILRRDNLKETMSSYLIHQIEEIKNIVVEPHYEIVDASGEGRLEKICLKHAETGETEERPVDSLFIFIGAKPLTDWLPAEVLKEGKGFVLTGRDLNMHPEFKRNWKKDREPFSLETSVPGIFAAGDVRANAMNRVASAVGEGAMAISFVHRYLSEI